MSATRIVNSLLQNVCTVSFGSLLQKVEGSRAGGGAKPQGQGARGIQNQGSGQGQGGRGITKSQGQGMSGRSGNVKSTNNGRGALNKRFAK